MTDLKIKNYQAFTQDLMRKGWLETSIIDSIVFNKELDLASAINIFTPMSKHSMDFKNVKNGSFFELRPIAGGINLSFIHAGNKLGEGHGTAAMKELTALCDEYGFCIELATYNEKSCIKEIKSLFKFYSCLGFNFNQIDGWEDVSSSADLTDEDHLEGVPMKRMPKGEASLGE